MTRKERLTRTLNGAAVDRPPVSFYEINGLEQKGDSDPFNIYSDPSWHPLIDLAREKTDRMAMCSVPFSVSVSGKTAGGGLRSPDRQLGSLEELVKTEISIEDGSRVVKTTIKAGSRTLTSSTRRDPDVNTDWTTEHLLKDVDDLKAWLELPEDELEGEPDISGVVETERELGESGIVMINTADPLCRVGPLFEMGEYTVIAMTEQKLFHRALEKAAKNIYRKTEAVAKALPGRLWRICGPEYASPPYLPPYLFEEYVVKYVKPMVEIIHKHGGYARVHSHGNLKDILDSIISTGCMGLDPIEPPPQGDVELAYVREKYGKQLVLFGNLEASDLENLSTDRFAEKIERALAEGTKGAGKGFVLMPSACPYGRKLSALAMKNYEKMIECVENF